MKRFQERTKEWVRSVISDKTKLAVALLILGLVTSVLYGCGILGIPQSKLAFRRMLLLTFILTIIWNIRKRRVNEKVQRSE